MEHCKTGELSSLHQQSKSVWRVHEGCTWKMHKEMNVEMSVEMHKGMQRKTPMENARGDAQPLQQKVEGDNSLPAQPLGLLQGSGGEPSSEQSQAGDRATTHRVIYPGPVRGTTFLLPLAATGRAFQLKKVPG